MGWSCGYQSYNEAKDSHALQVKIEAGDKQCAKDWQEKDKDGVLLYEGLFYVLEVIRIELISYYYHDLLTGHFGIKKPLELVAQKFHWSSLCTNVELYVKDYNIYLISKIVSHKLCRMAGVISGSNALMEISFNEFHYWIAYFFRRGRRNL